MKEVAAGVRKMRRAIADQDGNVVGSVPVERIEEPKR